VYWLNGVAGSGKTTITYSFAERVFAVGDLGGSFFCSRDFADRKNLHLIFPTLAFHLAYKYPAFRTHLVEAIKSNPNIGHGSLASQLKKLLVEPLQLTQLSTVIIIDALDECDDNLPASAILSLLAREIDEIPLVKFFITGRPESPIRRGFRLPALRPQTEILLLHEVNPTNVHADIMIFLEYQLKDLIKDRSDIEVTTPWPSTEDITFVASKAGGLFIYAATIVKFVASTTHTPQERLQLIACTQYSSVYEGKSGIDSLYTQILDKGCDHVDCDDSDFFSRLRMVVGSVVSLWVPITVASLARLLNLHSSDIFTPIRSLHSVLLVPDSDMKPIRVFHKSFPDYITDNRRCKDSRFCIDSPVHHGKLAIQCLELMRKELKRNICNLPQFSMNEDLPVHQFINETLVYVSRFWAKHLSLMSTTGNDVTQVLQLLKMFVQHHLLQWLEVLSIVKDLRGGIHSLLDVERWLLKVSQCLILLLNSQKLGLGQHFRQGFT
jgi:hypothetical protein